jgi:hypothetical protein
MQNSAPAGSETGGDDPLAQSEDSLSYEAPQATSSQPISDNTAHIASERKTRTKDLLRSALFGLLVLLVLGAGVFIFIRRGDTASQIRAGAFNEVRLPLSGVLVSDATEDSTQSLQVNGRLQVDESVVLAPTSQPDNPLTGQLYFDQDTSRLAYYDGTQFVNIQGSTTVTDLITNDTNVTNVTNNIGGGVELNGTPGSIAMFTSADTLGSSLINQSGNSLNIATSGNNQISMGGGSSAVTIEGSGGIQIGNAGGDHTIQIGTGAGVQNVSLGSAQASSATTIQAGTGDLNLSTGSSTGLTGSISITTGDSLTTASGNIAIDAGEGVVDGELIEDKTFEGGTDNMLAWFGSTVAQSSAQAHTGSNSLEMTATNSFWGVEEAILSATPVTAGHQYHFSFWVRAGSTPRTINGVVVWNGSGGQQVAFTPTIDSNAGWTQVTVTAPAPATATGAFFRFSSSGAAIGEKHYFDDITIVDLSSSSAISSISIGAENAKIVTIGNMNQIGATSIYGSSGISLNSGAAGITMNGGVLNITGNAASALNTTTGALTLTSAASAVWGVGTATSGVGGDLTLRAGRGGTDANNNGGDLILQGGNPNGTGTPGSVIVRPQTDTTDTFQVQSSASIPLLTANTATMTIIISGTNTAYATLTLADAHFTSSQTTPPTIGTPASCGVTPTAAVTAGSTDSAGSFTVTTGTGGTSSTCDTTLTFHQTYASTPKSIIVVGNTDAASAQRQAFVSAVTTTTFTVSFANSAAGADSTPYKFSYWIIE